MFINHCFLLFGLLVPCSVAYVYKVLFRLKQPPKPPGPKGLPIIGNIFDIPPGDGKQWLQWQKHKQLYGPISSVAVLGQTTVIINDYDLAVKLFEKRSGEFSDRPITQFGGQMYPIDCLHFFTSSNTLPRVGWQMSIPMTRYGDRLKNLRRLFHQFLGTKTSIAKFFPALEIETRHFLFRTMTNPSSLQNNIRK